MPHAQQLIEWPTIEAIVAGARLSLLYGPPGTGKTTAAVRAGKPSSCYSVTLTDETPAAELRGHWIPAGSEWRWMDGPAMLAFRGGGRLVLNEIDKASSDALDFCHALLDDPGIAAITLPSGETVTPHPDFKVVATMNGDPEDLPEAIRSRFAIRVNVTQPHPAAIESLPEDLRAAAAGLDPATDRAGDLRAWRTFGELRNTLDAETAAAAVFAHRALDVLDALRLAGVR